MADDKKKAATLAEFLAAEGLASADELAAKAAEWKSELGKQGNRIGAAEKSAQEAAAKLKQYEQALGVLNQQTQQYKQYYDWLMQNQQAIGDAIARQQLGIQGQNQNQRAHAESTILTPEERQELINAAAQNFSPYLSQLDQAWAQRAAQLQQDTLNRVRQQQQAHTDLIWSQMKHLVPKENLAKAEEIQKMALEYTKAENMDPLKLAEQFTEREMSRSALEQERDSYKEKFEKLEKQLTPSIGPSTGSSLFGDDKPDDENMSRSDVQRAVLEDVLREHSRDDLAAAFPGASGT